LSEYKRAKLINEKRRLQEENAFDLKCLEDSLISFQNEDEERAQRKHELMVEQQHYRRYLQELHEEEKRRERELEAIIEEDTERELQRQLNRFRAQKMERKLLLEKTLAERRLQIEEKIFRNQQRELEIERERLQFNKEIEFHKQLEIDQWVQSRNKVERYRSDLINQMDYNERQKQMVNGQCTFYNCGIFSKLLFLFGIESEDYYYINYINKTKTSFLCKCFTSNKNNDNSTKNEEEMEELQEKINTGKKLIENELLLITV
jgi:hypothetical protein